jgi:hypothetical protein
VADPEESDRIWAYVLESMNDLEREQMERDIEADPALRSEVEKTRQSSEVIGSLVARIEADVEPETLEQKILKGWERSESAVEIENRLEERAPPRPPQRAVRPMIPFSARPLIAMAACLLILVGGHFYLAQESLTWMEPRLETLGFKGPDAQSAYSRETLRDLSTRLGAEINEAYEAAGPDSFWKRIFRYRSDWDLQIQIHELDDGILQIDVAAYGDDPEISAKEWIEYADSEEAFNALIEPFGAEVASTLASMQDE